MSANWVPAPAKLPYRCFVTGQDSEADGPYWDTGRYFSECGGDDRELTLYLSVQAVREMLAAPGSPLVAMTREDRQALDAQIADQGAQLEERDLRIEDLESENDTLRAAPPVDVQALANALVIPLRANFASKPGPKPKAAA